MIHSACGVSYSQFSVFPVRTPSQSLPESRRVPRHIVRNLPGECSGILKPAERMESTNRGLLQLTSDTLVYGIGGAALRFVPLLLTPLLTRVLSPRDFGASESIGSLLLIVTTVVLLGTDSAANFLFFREDTESGRLSLSGTWIVLMSLCSTAASLLLLSINQLLLHLLNLSSADIVAFSLSILSIPFVVVCTVLLELQRLYFQPWRYVTVALASSLFQITCTLLLVVVLGVGLEGYFFAYLSANLFACIVGFLLSRGSIRVTFQWVVGARLLTFGAPLILASVGFWAISASNRLFVGHQSLDTLASFSAGAKVAQGLAFFLTAFLLAWGPFGPSIASQDNCRVIYARILFAYSGIASGLVLALAAFGPLLLHIVAPPGYAAGNQVVGLMAASAALYGAYQIVAIGVCLTGKSKHIAWTTLFGGGVTAAASPFLLSLLGMVGVAIASVLGSGVAVGSLYVVAQRCYAVEYKIKRVLGLPAVALVLTLPVSMGPLSTTSPAAHMGGLLAYGLFAAWYVCRAWHVAPLGWALRRFHRRPSISTL